jgi:hypothetical protein
MLSTDIGLATDPLATVNVKAQGTATIFFSMITTCVFLNVAAISGDGGVVQPLIAPALEFSIAWVGTDAGVGLYSDGLCDRQTAPPYNIGVPYTVDRPAGASVLRVHSPWLEPVTIDVGAGSPGFSVTACRDGAQDCNSRLCDENDEVCLCMGSGGTCGGTLACCSRNCTMGGVCQ